MAFTEFCCRSGGSNLNAGTRTGDSTEPGTAADLTYASGSWVQSTGVFTVASGDPATDGVAVGDFASVYPDAETVTPFVGRVTARDATTITVSLTAKAGTAPVDGTNDTTLKIGGAWAGPNGASGFPFNFATGALVNAAGDDLRVNLKGGTNYDITAAMTHTLIGPVTFQGYTTSYGDEGAATVDGGTSGASYVLLTVSGSGVDRTRLFDLILQNNGATGSAAGLAPNTDQRTQVGRVVVANVRGTGFNSIRYGFECEAYGCNQSNTANAGGFVVASNGVLDRCISHDNAGSNSAGFYTQGTGALLKNCIADSNGGHGARFNNTTAWNVVGCDFYNNVGDGIHHLSGTAMASIESTNFVKNGGYGINVASGSVRGRRRSNGFGAGTQANTSGTFGGTDNFDAIDEVTYADDVTPWVDPANGDFRINLAAAQGTGRGNFTQTAGSYAGAVGFPDIGAAQHEDAGGSGAPGNMSGGLQ